MLRLLADDADDLALISAALQDAVTRIGDIHWDPKGRAVTIAFNRFRWEAEGRVGQRVRAGLQVGGVLDVKARRLRQGAKSAVLELLAIAFQPAEEPPGGRLLLTFAGGGDLAVGIECIDVVLADVSEPWSTPRTPGHAG